MNRAQPAAVNRAQLGDDELLHELAEEGGLLTPAEAAARVGVTADVVRRWAERGEVLAVRVGGRWQVGASSVVDTEHRMRTRPTSRPGRPRTTST